MKMKNKNKNENIHIYKNIKLKTIYYIITPQPYEMF